MIIACNTKNYGGGMACKPSSLHVEDSSAKFHPLKKNTVYRVSHHTHTSVAS